MSNNVDDIFILLEPYRDYNQSSSILMSFMYHMVFEFYKKEDSNMNSFLNLTHDILSHNQSYSQKYNYDSDRISLIITIEHEKFLYITLMFNSIEEHDE